MSWHLLYNTFSYPSIKSENEEIKVSMWRKKSQCDKIEILALLKSFFSPCFVCPEGTALFQTLWNHFKIMFSGVLMKKKWVSGKVHKSWSPYRKHASLKMLLSDCSISEVPKKRGIQMFINYIWVKNYSQLHAIIHWK